MPGKAKLSYVYAVPKLGCTDEADTSYLPNYKTTFQCFIPYLVLECIHEANTISVLLIFNIQKALPNQFKDSSVFCANNEGFNFGSCEGDSGGPIRIFDDSDWRFRQIGVVHGSISDCDGSRFPSIFVRLDNPLVLDFIQRTVFGTGLCKVFFTTLLNYSITRKGPDTVRSLSAGQQV